MTFDKLSIRLGMHHGLYIGICIGFIVSAVIVVVEHVLFRVGMTHIFATFLALICAALMVIAIIFLLENKEFRSSDLTCTCRYRSSLYTLCKKCALYPPNQVEKDKNPDSPEN